MTSPLYRHYLSSKLAGYLSEPRLSFAWPSVQSFQSVISVFDTKSLAAAASGSLTEYAFSSLFGRAVSRYEPNFELLCEMRWGGQMRADFVLGTLESRHVIEVLMGESNLAEHAQRALIYRDSLWAKTCCLICYCDQAPSSFVTFHEVPVFYVWPNEMFLGLGFNCPKLP